MHTILSYYFLYTAHIKQSQIKLPLVTVHYSLPCIGWGLNSERSTWTSLSSSEMYSTLPITTIANLYWKVIKVLYKFKYSLWTLLDYHFCGVTVYTISLIHLIHYKKNPCASHIGCVEIDLQVKITYLQVTFLLPSSYVLLQNFKSNNSEEYYPWIK